MAALSKSRQPTPRERLALGPVPWGRGGCAGRRRERYHVLARVLILALGLACVFGQAMGADLSTTQILDVIIHLQEARSLLRDTQVFTTGEPKVASSQVIWKPAWAFHRSPRGEPRSKLALNYSFLLKT